MVESKLHIPLGSLGRNIAQDLPYSRPQTPGQPTHVQLGWIGLGAMGYLIARNLANYRADHLESQTPLLVWTRSKDKSEKLQHELGEHKIAIAQSVVDIATSSDIILVSLSGDDVVKSVYNEIAAALQAQPPTKRKIFVETSTVSRDRFFAPVDTSHRSR
jgi:3-hydroxyisobutyrate dehydrogenase-like beta-hydroxyacid dehydrogenase